MILFFILTTLSLDNVWTLLGENCCWSLLGLKGLIRHQNSSHGQCLTPNLTTYQDLNVKDDLVICQ